MKIVELDLRTFREILKMEDDKLNNIKGYDLDNFAKECASGNIEGIEAHPTKASVDILYIKNKQLYKIEGKDISKTILSKAIRPHLSNVGLSEHYIKGISSNRDKKRLENNEEVKLKSKAPIDMEKLLVQNIFLIYCVIPKIIMMKDIF